MLQKIKITTYVLIVFLFGFTLISVLPVFAIDPNSSQDHLGRSPGDPGYEPPPGGDTAGTHGGSQDHLGRSPGDPGYEPPPGGDTAGTHGGSQDHLGRSPGDPGYEPPR
jgi:hypothetical protein